MELVFFDMDYTVLGHDCDVLWKYFLADEGIAPESARNDADRYVDLYHKGELPVSEYIEFQIKEFAGNTAGTMMKLSRRHFEKYVRKYIYPDAVREIEKYQAQGIGVVLLTGTNRIIATPIAEALGADLIATELEIRNGQYTGDITGPFLIKENKTLMALEYCQKRKISLDQVAFYADSINDVEFLEKVALATVVNPRSKLAAIAAARNWRVVRWTLPKG